MKEPYNLSSGNRARARVCACLDGGEGGGGGVGWGWMGVVLGLTVAVLIVVFFKRCASSQMTSPNLMFLTSSTDRKNIS